MVGQVVVRCRKCGTTRTSYNDPRAHPGTVIECATHCYESHPLWDYVGEHEEAPAAPPPAAPVQRLSPDRKEDRDPNPRAASKREDDGSKPRIRQAFAEEEGDNVDIKGGDAPKKKEDSTCPCIAM